MKIGRKFNLLTLKKYKHYIENHKKYLDFNTLGLYRSILENDKLTNADKIEVRNFANKFFLKSFNFLQIKDPETYLKLSTLGESLTAGDQLRIEKTIRRNQERILKSKKIKHRNFGVYSRHCGGYPGECYFNDLMVKRKSYLVDAVMTFDSDNRKFGVHFKSSRLKRERKHSKHIIDALLFENEIE